MNFQLNTLNQTPWRGLSREGSRDQLVGVLGNVAPKQTLRFGLSEQSHGENKGAVVADRQHHARADQIVPRTERAAVPLRFHNKLRLHSL